MKYCTRSAPKQKRIVRLKEITVTKIKKNKNKHYKKFTVIITMRQHTRITPKIVA